MFIHLKALAGAAACGLGVFAACGAALAQSYPASPLRWIVPFPAGSGTDVMTRAIAQPLALSLGKPVIVENRAGANTLIGMEAAAKAAPDGYTMVTVVIGSVVFNPFMYPKLPYDPQRDFAPVSLFARVPLMLVVGESSPAKSLNEFVAYARAHPGKLNYGSSGVGHTFYLAMEMFKRRTRTDLVHVPYKGTNLVTQDLVADRLDAMFSAPVDSLSLVKAGKLRALATATRQRLPSLPDVPTFEEAGLPEFGFTSWMAVMMPAGTPKEIVARLNREIVKIVNSPELSKFYANLNMLPATNTPEEFAQLIQKESETWGPLIKSLGISLE
jgi:tripartite-type tricarboxylate transporter receptor subunit TctC